MQTNFYNVVIHHFRYLIDDFSFAVKDAESSERAPATEGLVEFASSETFVRVVGEQWTVATSIGRIKDDKYKYYLDPSTIYEYATLTDDDKRLVCSLDPKQDRKARSVIQRIRLAHRRNDAGNLLEDIEGQVVDYSLWLRQYADSFLRGDFSQWLNIYEYKVARNRAAYIRSGKDEFVRVAGRSTDFRESIFQNSLDYLARLRDEYKQN